MIPERVPVKHSRDLHLLRPLETSEAAMQKLSDEELDRICSLEIDRDDPNVMAALVRHRPQTALAVLQALLLRNPKDELPVQTETFVYRRNLKECRRLKESILWLEGKDLDLTNSRVQEKLRDASRLLRLERKKAEWLELHFYPQIYERAVNSARGEVNQFLMRQVSTVGLEHFRDAQMPDVFLRDELSYILADNPLDSEGVFRGSHIELRIPEYFTDRDEWRVYLITVHELLHSVSHQEHGDLGIERPSIHPDLRELNEAITELLTYYIALEHLDKEKTTLQGQRQRHLSLAEMPYSEYTLIVRQIFSKIPLAFFTNAMLNQSGWEALRLKFRDELGSEDAVIAFARNLRNAYLPPQKRKPGKILPFKRQGTETPMS